MTVGWLRSEQDRDDEAAACAERALEIDPRHFSAPRARIGFLQYAKRWEEAEAAAQQALELRPEDPDLHVTVGWLRSARDRDDEAAACAERALEIDPRHSWALRARIDFLRYARRWEEAEAAAEQALEQRAEDPDLLVTVGWLRSEQDRDDEAAACAERALAIDPRQSWALRSRIDFGRTARRWMDAETAARQALEWRPKDPDLYVALGELQHEIGHYKDALTCLRRRWRSILSTWTLTLGKSPSCVSSAD